MSPRTKVNDDEILRYLETHTYDETQDHFGISRMTVARVKKRNQVKVMPNRIRLAIVGCGNAASALVQGIEFYKSRNNNIGLLHPTLAGYHISDIEIVAAFDISKKKVGLDLSKALESNEFEMNVSLENSGIKVLMGSLEDGVIPETETIIPISSEKPCNVSNELQNADAQIVLCLLPSGADHAVYFYAEESLNAGCAFINATPTSIATNKEYATKFKDAGLALVGDDLQDQFGATILHKLILKQMLNQGVNIKESYALDVGGGAESLNTIYRTRHIKRDIKSKSVSESLKTNAPIVAGTSDYVPHLHNGRNSMLWIVGKGFLGTDIIMDIKIQTTDGPNGGAILADVIRATQIALHQGTGGPIESISAYGFKNPPKKISSPEEASEMLARFVLGINGGDN